MSSLIVLFNIYQLAGGALKYHPGCQLVVNGSPRRDGPAWRIKCTYLCPDDGKEHTVIIRRRNNPAEVLPPVCPNPYDVWDSE